MCCGSVIIIHRKNLWLPAHFENVSFLRLSHSLPEYEPVHTARCCLALRWNPRRVDRQSTLSSHALSTHRYPHRHALESSGHFRTASIPLSPVSNTNGIELTPQLSHGHM